MKQARAKGQHGCKPSFLARGSASSSRKVLLQVATDSLRGRLRWSRLVSEWASGWPTSATVAIHYKWVQVRLPGASLLPPLYCGRPHFACGVEPHVLSPMCGGELEWRQTSDTAGRLPGETSLESRQGNSSRQSHQQDASTCFRTPYLLRCTVRLELRLYKCWGRRKTHHPCLTPEVASAGRRVARYVHVPGS